MYVTAGYCNFIVMYVEVLGLTPKARAGKIMLGNDMEKQMVMQTNKNNYFCGALIQTFINIWYNLKTTDCQFDS